jgi:hypothetical protein
MVKTNGARPDVELREEPEDDDLLGTIEIALRDERERLRGLVERCDVLAELRRRALEVAQASPDDRAPVTGPMLRAHALATGGEEDAARLENLFSHF